MPLVHLLLHLAGFHSAGLGEDRHLPLKPKLKCRLPRLRKHTPLLLTFILIYMRQVVVRWGSTGEQKAISLHCLPPITTPQ